MFERYIAKRFLAALERTEYGSLEIATPDGKKHLFKGSAPGAEAQLDLYDWSVVDTMIRHGDIALAESYRDGLWDSPDPTQLFLFGLQNQSAMGDYIDGSAFGRLASRIAYLFTRNSVQGSKKNIHAHYDLGNDFYALWLDPSMTYSSAIFRDENENLEDAQTRKYDRMIDRLNPSGSLLEIGCGWGGFAERALQRGDYGIKGLTISKAQHEYAANRMGKNAEIALEDYRHQQGLYDQIVSIEMFEAVGEKFWPVYFSTLKSLLAKKGRAMIQSITIADASFDRYRTSGDAIRTFIFPGGMLPSPSRFKAESAKAGLHVTNDFSFGQHYALTLTHWLNNFDEKINAVKAMGFDQKFIRMWRFYLTCCIAAFKHERIDVMQWELQHAT
ncbi:MAG TPA: cyclopropane-fatty-acyl-phospholipid synthase family protein [Cellvibrio sp.]|nr:cyclopropane-fatty-acyl-phospholipid synthase family protein [Cellvibrio sp.]